MKLREFLEKLENEEYLGIVIKEILVEGVKYHDKKIKRKILEENLPFLEKEVKNIFVDWCDIGALTRLVVTV